MKTRTLTLAAGLTIALLTAGCATSVGGQAQVNPAAVVAASAAAPSSAAAPASSSEEASVSSQVESTAPTTTASSPSASPSTVSTSPAPTAAPTTATPTTTRSSKPSPTAGPTSIPGFSADCNKILAGITAFSSLLSDASSGSANATISQASVDAALKDLPASGLPAKAQADVTVLRATASSAAGKTITQLALTLSDGKVVAALEDLTTWASTNCS